jgi:predicted ATPase
MLRFIRIHGFKLLNNAQFPLASLNLFSGLNGMGKSSLIQALLLLRQSNEKNTLFNKGLLLKGDYVSLGTGQDILAESAEKEEIEFTAHYIAEYGLSPLAVEALKHKDSPSLSLLDNLDKWMAEISPGVRIHAKLQPAMNVVSLNYAFQQGTDITADFKPQNVGFGLTFVLPVLTAILRSKPGDMIIIENPEAHLHPAGQSTLGRLCSIAANNGVQLFIETHSDHFLNGIRVCVREKIIPSHEVKVFYLERSTTSVHEALVVNPEIDESGRIDLWPQGFFDEGDRLLEKLL